MTRSVTTRLAAVLVLAALAGPVEGRGEERPLVPPAAIPDGGAARPLLAGWLEEGSQREAAWGAWEAGERDLMDLGPLVAARLEREVEREGRARSGMLELVLLDAAIRLCAEVPAATLGGIGWTREGVATYLCLREAGPAHLEGFEAIDRKWSMGSRTWFAIGGCLFEAKVPAFARRLLAGWSIERMLRVWDRDGPYPPWGRPSDAVHGDGIAPIPEGYPPIPQRRLSLHRLDDWTRLVGGPFPVYGARYVFCGPNVHSGDVGGRPKRDVARHAWLAAWLEGTDVPAFPPWDVVHVKWTGGRQPWARKTTVAVLAIHDGWRAWRDALLARDLLTPALCEGLAPHIIWEVRDERRVRKRPIPPLPDVPFEPRLPAPHRHPRASQGV